MGIPIIQRRTILLSGDIDKDSVKNIIEYILNTNNSDEFNKEEYGDKYKIKPIYLFINSYGGFVYDGFALIDAIKTSKTPIYTISLGSAMSMGLLILLSGHKRFISENSTLMYHEISSGTSGKLEEMKMDIEETQRLSNILDGMVIKNTSVRQSELDEIKKKQKDWFISSDEGIKLGFGEKWEG